MALDLPILGKRQQSFQEQCLPSGWSARPLTANGLKLNCYEVGDPNSPVRIGLAMGHKSLAIPEHENIDSFVSNGFNAVILELPYVDKSLDFIDLYKAALESFYFNPESPLFRDAHNLHGLVGMTHSTSGLLVEDLLFNKLRARFAEQNFDGFLHIAPIYDTANSSQRFHPRNNRIYSWHAKRHLHTLCGEATGDTMFTSKDPHAPTHGQALEIRDYGRAYQEKVLNRGNPSSLERQILIGDEDVASCHQTAKFIGDHCGIKATVLPGKNHALFRNEPALSEDPINDPVFNNTTGINDPVFRSTTLDAIWSLVPGTPPHLRPESLVDEYSLSAAGIDDERLTHEEFQNIPITRALDAKVG